MGQTEKSEIPSNLFGVVFISVCGRADVDGTIIHTDQWLDIAFMVSLQDVLVDSLWILGIAGVLATLSYMNWYRRTHGLTWRHVLSLPRALIPLCVSMEIFCIGIATNGVLSEPAAPWWETAAWSVLAILFAVQTIAYGIAGARNGWDTPLEERDEDERPEQIR